MNWVVFDYYDHTGMISSLSSMENFEISGIVCTFCGHRIPEYHLFRQSWIELQTNEMASTAETFLHYLYYEHEFIYEIVHNHHRSFVSMKCEGCVVNDNQQNGILQVLDQDCKLCNYFRHFRKGQ